MDKPKVKLVDTDGNAFAILARCMKAAKRAGWSQEKLTSFQKEATSGDYDHLLQTVLKHFDDARNGVDE